ncbi:MAG: hypothetical protein R3C53_11475 [Pirellulaceae bacterium]
MELSPQNRTARLILGRVYVTQRNWSEAIDQLRGLVESDAYDHEPRLLLGRALVGSGDTERGRQEIEAATDLKNTFLKFADMHQEAITKPTEASIRIELGQLAEKLGKFKLASTWYQLLWGWMQTMHSHDALKRLQALGSEASANRRE